MKKILCIVLALCFVFALAACTTETPPPPADPGASTPSDPTPADPAPADPASPADPSDPEPAAPAEAFPGIIAVVTNDVSQSEEEFRSGEMLVEKYGADKVIHAVWPANFVAEGEQMITVIQQIAENPEVKGLIINQAVVGTNAAVDKLLEIRDDVFIVYCSPAEAPADTSVRANLLLNSNDLLRGVTIVEQAVAMGADKVAHYSFPRHMANPVLAGRRDIMAETAEKLGIEFIELPAPDPTGPDGIPGTQQFIMEDVPRQVETLGANTAFFATNCAMQIPLVTQIVDTGAIYPEPCCPSPYHAFPSALGIQDRIFDGSNMVEKVDDDGNVEMIDAGRQRSISEVVAEIRADLSGRGAAGRLGTWPVPASMMWTIVGFEYTAAFLNGDAPQGREVSYELLEHMMSDFMFELTGERIGAELNPLSLQGRSWQNYVMIIIGSLVF